MWVLALFAYLYVTVVMAARLAPKIHNEIGFGDEIDTEDWLFACFLGLVWPVIFPFMVLVHFAKLVAARKGG